MAAYIFKCSFTNPDNLSCESIPDFEETCIVQYRLKKDRVVSVKISIRANSDQKAVRISNEIEKKLNEVFGSSINPRLNKVERLR